MNIIVYVIDSLRSDHLSCYGYSRQTTPNIDAIADEGLKFINCFTTSTWTSPAAVSLLSGQYPCVHGVKTKDDRVAGLSSWLPLILQKNGYLTSCISGIGNVSRAKGFSTGFDYFVDLYNEPREKLISHKKSSSAIEGMDTGKDIILPYAEDINQYFFSWFDDNLSSNKFSLLWAIDPHAPYEPPPKFRKFVSEGYDKRFTGKRDMVRLASTPEDTKYLIDLYDSEIFYTDYAFGKLVQFLRKKDQYDESLIIILGDHGEAFGEHGIFAHGHIPYETVMKVPLVIKFPSDWNQGGTISSLSSLVDITPTLLDYLQIPFPFQINQSFIGKSLLPILDSREEEVHDSVFCETEYSNTKPAFLAYRSRSWKYIKAIRKKKTWNDILRLISRIHRENIIFSFIRNPRYLFKRYTNIRSQMLFNIREDPEELTNLASELTNKVNEIEELLTKWRADCLSDRDQNLSLEGLTTEENQKLREHLEALGYLD